MNLLFALCLVALQPATLWKRSVDARAAPTPHSFESASTSWESEESIESLESPEFPDTHEATDTGPISQRRNIAGLLVPLIERGLSHERHPSRKKKVIRVLPLRASKEHSATWPRINPRKKHVVEITPLRGKGRDGKPLAYILAPAKSGLRGSHVKRLEKHHSGYEQKDYSGHQSRKKLLKELKDSSFSDETSEERDEIISVEKLESSEELPVLSYGLRGKTGRKTQESVSDDNSNTFISGPQSKINEEPVQISTLQVSNESDQSTLLGKSTGGFISSEKSNLVSDSGASEQSLSQENNSSTNSENNDQSLSNDISNASNSYSDEPTSKSSNDNNNSQTNSDDIINKTDSDNQSTGQELSDESGSNSHDTDNYYFKKQSKESYDQSQNIKHEQSEKVPKYVGTKTIEGGPSVENPTEYKIQKISKNLYLTDDEKGHSFPREKVNSTLLTKDSQPKIIKSKIEEKPGSGETQQSTERHKEPAKDQNDNANINTNHNSRHYKEEYKYHHTVHRIEEPIDSDVTKLYDKITERNVNTNHSVQEALDEPSKEKNHEENRDKKEENFAEAKENNFAKNIKEGEPTNEIRDDFQNETKRDENSQDSTIINLDKTTESAEKTITEIEIDKKPELRVTEGNFSTNKSPENKLTQPNDQNKTEKQNDNSSDVEKVNNLQKTIKDKKILVEENTINTPLENKIDQPVVDSNTEETKKESTKEEQTEENTTLKPTYEVKSEKPIEESKSNQSTVEGKSDKPKEENKPDKPSESNKLDTITEKTKLNIKIEEIKLDERTEKNYLDAPTEQTNREKSTEKSQIENQTEKIKSDSSTGESRSGKPIEKSSIDELTNESKSKEDNKTDKTTSESESDKLQIDNILDKPIGNETSKQRGESETEQPTVESKTDKLNLEAESEKPKGRYKLDEKVEENKSQAQTERNKTDEPAEIYKISEETGALKAEDNYNSKNTSTSKESGISELSNNNKISKVVEKNIVHTHDGHKLEGYFNEKKSKQDKGASKKPTEEESSVENLTAIVTQVKIQTSSLEPDYKRKTIAIQQQDSLSRAWQPETKKLDDWIPHSDEADSKGPAPCKTSSQSASSWERTHEHKSYRLSFLFNK